MAAYNTFPSLPGLGWSVSKEPQFKTRIQKGVSGRESRLTFQPAPTWMFTLTFEFLRDQWDVRQANQFGPAGWGTTLNELRTLMGFFLQQQGSLTPFLFDDPSDDSVVNQGIGSGDGTTTAFQLLRTMNGFNEPIIAPNVVSAIYVNSALQSPSTYSVNYATGVVTFNTPPADEASLSATFTYYFLVRFSDDNLSFENFLYQLWSVKELKLQSVLL